MKKILISQRIDHLPERMETREGIDIKICKIMINLGFIPIPISNSFGDIQKDKLFEYIDSLEPHGFILSGGNDLNEYKQRDILEKTLIEYAILKRKPLMGICRGMQILANFFGSHIEPINNHVNSERIVKGVIHKKIRCFHKYKIATCPKDFSILSISDDGCIEAIKSKNYPMIGIMWHFEREEKLDYIDKNLIMELFQ